jgi:hypothetical protein
MNAAMRARSHVELPELYPKTVNQMCVQLELGKVYYSKKISTSMSRVFSNSTLASGDKERLRSPSSSIRPINVMKPSDSMPFISN